MMSAMSTEFRYERIGQKLTEKLSGLLTQGESGVLLGLRDIGKRYLLQKVLRSLKSTGSGGVIFVDFLREPRLTTAADVRSAMAGAAGITDAEGEAMLASIDAWRIREERTPILIAANVDSLAHHQARRFLQEVQVRVKERHLVVLLSGEENLCELTHGLNSAFNCADQFVIQGFDAEEFAFYVERRLKLVRVSFSDHAKAIGRMYALTGGNVHLARALVGIMAERRARVGNDGLSDVVSETELEECAANLPEMSAFGANVFQRSVGIIDRNPGTWTALQKFSETETTPAEGHHPHALELAGVCVREAEANGDPVLRLASPMMEGFLRHFYDKRRWGDRYGAQGNWQEAFRCYAALDAEMRIRPADVEDRQEVLATVRALGSKLQAEATAGEHDASKLERLRLLFVHGCQYLLGSAHVLFWQWRGQWELLPEHSAPDDVVRHLTERLAAIDPQRHRTLPLNVEVGRTDAFTVLPALREDGMEAVAVSDFETGVVLSRERAALLAELLDHFHRAFSHAIAGCRVRARLAVQDRYFRIAQSILQGLGATVRKPRQVLEAAARKLRLLGYKRVLFCLVDPVAQRIKGSVDDSDNLIFVDLARMTDYALDDPKKDIQPYVVTTRRRFIVADAAQEPLTNPEANRMADLHSFAVVPMLNESGDCVGTIHVERADGLVPTETEAVDLEEFGRQLAAVLELSERVNLLQVTLDKINEPVALLDRRLDLRYVNEPAAKLFGFVPGWRDRKALESFLTDRTRALGPILATAMLGKAHAAMDVRDLQPGRVDRVVADPVLDEAGDLVGITVHLREVKLVYALLRALEVFAATNQGDAEALHQMLEAVKELGCSWARLYLIDPNNPDVLVSERSLNFPDPSGDFDARRVRVQRPVGRLDESFLCIENGKPVVLRWMPDEDEGETFDAERHIHVTHIREPQMPDYFQKTPGDYWLDLPLLAGPQRLGKLSVEIPKNWTAEELNLIAVFVQMVNELLTVRTARGALEREQMLREASREALAIAAHNIGNRLASMDVVKSRYRFRESNAPELRPLNDELESISDGCFAMVRRIEEYFGLIIPTPVPCDLRKHLQALICRDDIDGTIDCPESLEVEWDPTLIDEALRQMIVNSRQMVTAERKVEVKLTARAYLEDGEERVELTVSDNGPGVPDGFKVQIFDSFFTMRPGTGPKNGSGLGLYYVARVIKAHGGHLREAGTFGAGAKFILTLPRRATRPAST